MIKNINNNIEEARCIEKFDCNGNAIVYYNKENKKLIMRKNNSKYFLDLGKNYNLNIDNEKPIRSLDFITKSKVLISLSGSGGTYIANFGKIDKITDSTEISAIYENSCLLKNEAKKKSNIKTYLIRKNNQDLELVKFDPFKENFDLVEKKKEICFDSQIFNIKSLKEKFFVNTRNEIWEIDLKEKNNGKKIDPKKVIKNKIDVNININKNRK